MFDFSTPPEMAALSGADIAYRCSGSGPALLCLHGYPQTMYMWHKIADRLAQHFTVILADLRGYGDSSAPATDAQHSPYSKRAMAADMAELMAHLGHDSYAVIGHDRGGRVAHRMARDHADHITKLTVLDIAPTSQMYDATDMEFARAYYHWFFLIQPAPLPETLIEGAAESFLIHKLGHWGKTQDAHTPQAVSEYKRCFCRPQTIHASCEDYRAAAGIDLNHDAEDRHIPLSMPVQVLWGADGFVGHKFDPVAEWRKQAPSVQGHAVPGGHFLPEEAPEETLNAVLAFLA